MRALKGILQLLLALVCLAAALVYCALLGGGRICLWVWELGDEFVRQAFNTELRDFFRREQ